MIEIIPTTKQIKKARKFANEIGLLKNSIRNGYGTLQGCLGEVIAADYYGFKINHSYNYDLVNKNKQTIDVKTKSCTSKPKSNYECSIAAFNTKQDCDFYLFVRIFESLEVGWILGYISKKEYFQKARFCKKDEIDKKSELGWKFKADCYNLEINQLKIK